ncbi:MAG: hypothetical protein KOO69_08910 [Victivallales bacterium]|nr:hypothetical protein [Victivallales bacterium]
MEKPVQSANFKKDYIAYSAIAIFFLIISFEIFMAIFIPAHLQIEGVWSEEVGRQDMVNQFDHVRNSFFRFKSKDEYAQNEALIINNSLTPLADYLREYQYKIGVKEVKEIDKTISGMLTFRSYLDKDGAYSKDMKIDTKNFIKTLKKSMEKTD